ncbi:MAG: DUF2750 domain-containing protein [Armatimonadetes bacterium]|nr:DUF2750 domain-containing protein [Armatimonadota bacterium]
MSWIVSDKELESVFSLPAPKRYEYFVKRVADSEEVWSVGDNDGWALLGNDEGKELVPVWPHERYAAACAKGPFSGNEPRMIPLDAWMERWLPGLEKDGRGVAVFPTLEGTAAHVSPEQLRDDLREELEKYE